MTSFSSPPSFPPDLSHDDLSYGPFHPFHAELISIVLGVTVFLFVMCMIAQHAKFMEKKAEELKKNNSQLIPIAIVQFLDDIEREKPIRFTSQQLRIATNNFNIKLGSGGFGIVYKGAIGNNRPVAVKVLNGTSNPQIGEQFMAEVSTMGRTHHFNLVRLYGFCFESSLIALVYEFMANGSLDNLLFKGDKGAMIGFDKLHEIAMGTARGITYLHDECAQRIVHYDIKPGNILLDSNFCAKVADFGLAKLCNKDNTHISITGGRGTPGYIAPEVWMRRQVTHKCDVYSFGMLLFDIIGRRRKTDINSQQCFPSLAWGKYENNQLKDLMIDCEIEENDHEVAERMLKVALCCVQYRAETRPVMSIVVKMLEGLLEVPDPLNPSAHSEVDDFFGQMALKGVVKGTPLMRKYEITMASDQ